MRRNRVQGRCQAERKNGNVVFLAEALRGVSDLLSGLEGEAGKTLETVKLAVRRARLEDAVGKKNEALGRAQFAPNQGVHLIGNEAEGQCRWRAEFATGEIGRNVARVSERVLAGERDADAARGGKAEVALRDENVVETGENVAGIVGGLATQSAENHGDTHRRRQTFS